MGVSIETMGGTGVSGTGQTFIPGTGLVGLCPWREEYYYECGNTLNGM
ncbi:hypothetical protein GW742_10215 [Citrobacter freundii]|nr:hypothetical protein [Citrobacter freundii]MBC6506714.1 hypothetical protein [Citrobacter freundii]